MLYGSLGIADGLPASEPLEKNLSQLPTRIQGGAIVNMASFTARTPLGDIYAYGTSKAAVAHFTACLAKDVWKHGIRVNSVSPGKSKQEWKFLSQCYMLHT